MRVSMSTEHIDGRFGLEKTIQMIAEAGFTAFDLTLCQSCQKGGLFDCDDWREKHSTFVRWRTRPALPATKRMRRLDPVLWTKRAPSSSMAGSFAPFR